MNQIKGYQSWGYLLLVASLSCICVATLYPFEFAVPQGFSGESILDRFNFGSNIRDYCQNILLFIPLGISLYLIFARQQYSIWLIFIFCLLTSSLVSGGVEFTQLFLSTRVSNLTDIIYNSIGGVLGGILFCWRRDIIRFVTGVLTANQKKLSFKSLVTAIALYCSLIILAIGVLLNNINLSNWDNNYDLAIGNEVTGDRPWHGYINSLYICDRALNRSEMIRAFDEPDSFFSGLSGLVTAFTFLDMHQFYRDETGNIANLQWHKAPPSLITKHYQEVNVLSSPRADLYSRIYQYSGISLSEQQWLKTSAPAVFLNKQLKNTGEFSLMITIAPQETEQTGPARIIALSHDIHAQNMILAQSGKNLIFRLRTPITGSNATEPAFSIPNVFADGSFHQILITFAAKKLSFYLDYIDDVYFYKFNIYNSFSSFLPWNRPEKIVNLASFNNSQEQLLFYTVIFFPLIILIYYLSWKIKNNT